MKIQQQREKERNTYLKDSNSLLHPLEQSNEGQLTQLAFIIAHVQRTIEKQNNLLKQRNGGKPRKIRLKC